MNINNNNNFVLVIDLEACCWLGNPPSGMYKEIIEIGLVRVNYFTKDIIDSRSIIVKPKYSEISNFCTELTTLTQEYIDNNGISFEESCDILRKEYNSTKRMWFSWGDYDKSAFQKECSLKQIEYPLGKNHFNLK